MFKKKKKKSLQQLKKKKKPACLFFLFVLAHRATESILIIQIKESLNGRIPINMCDKLFFYNGNYVWALLVQKVWLSVDVEN